MMTAFAEYPRAVEAVKKGALGFERYRIAHELRPRARMLDTYLNEP